MADLKIMIGNKFTTAGVEVYVYQKNVDGSIYLGKATKTDPCQCTITADAPLDIILVPEFSQPPFYLAQYPYYDDLKVISEQSGYTATRQQLNNTDWRLTISLAGTAGPVGEPDTTNVTVGEPQ